MESSVCVTCGRGLLLNVPPNFPRKRASIKALDRTAARHQEREEERRRILLRYRAPREKRSKAILSIVRREERRKRKVGTDTLSCAEREG